MSLKAVLLPLLCISSALAQTPTPTPTLNTSVVPNSIAIYGQYNQLSTAGSPWTGGVAGIYRITTNISGVLSTVFMTTSLDLSPKYATDPTTGKHFWALSGSFRQGIHKVFAHPGKAAFSIGGDVGPTFASPTGGLSTSIAVSASSSFVATTFYQVTPTIGFVMPLRMLYVSGIGWNPVAEVGITINLGKASK